MKFAACRDADPELFFPTSGEHEKIRAAKQICFDCRVQTQCHNYHEASGDRYGVWAGRYYDNGRTEQ